MLTSLHGTFLPGYKAKVLWTIVWRVWSFQWLQIGAFWYGIDVAFEPFNSFAQL